jgi:hypothetical protein
MTCPKEILDQVELALVYGYKIDEVVVVKAPDGYSFWDWHLSQDKGAVFQKLRRPGCWLVLQVFGQPAPGMYTYQCEYWPTGLPN